MLNSMLTPKNISVRCVSGVWGAGRNWTSVSSEFLQLHVTLPFKLMIIFMALVFSLSEVTCADKLYFMLEDQITAYNPMDLKSSSLPPSYNAMFTALLNNMVVNIFSNTRPN